MNHLKMHSMDKIDENVSKISALFPNCVTEAKAEDGSITKKIDFDMLKQELSHSLVEGREERYQFTWPDKKQAILTANAPINKTLRPCREESVNFDETENLYIEGDNLEVLKLLQETYLGKIKMIYIDPPYNTGNDFVYNDEFSVSSSEFSEKSGNFDEEGKLLVDNYTRNTESNGRFHTDWLNMMYPRLKLARDLLSEDGVIFISIDDNEVASCQFLVKEIFGDCNFVAQFPWRKRTAKSDVPFGVSQDYEWIVCCAKSENFKASIESKERKYFETEDFPNKPWRFHDLTTQRTIQERPNSNFTIINPKNKEEFPVNPLRCWAVTKETFEDYYKQNRIIFPGDYDFLKISKPVLRYWKEEDMKKSGDNFGKIAVSTKLPDNIGMSQDGTKEITALLGTKAFPYPKSVELIKYLVKISTDSSQLNTDNSPLILDFFSGSATTAHAVMQLNAEDGGNRKFIMVQLPELCDEKSEAYKAGYKNICEIGKERIRRAGRKTVESYQLSVDSCKGGKDGKLQRASSLAEVNGNGQGDLFAGEETAEGRNLCTLGSDEAGSCVDSVEYSGRTGTKLEERICTVSENSERFKVGTGNSTADLQGNRVSDGNRNSEGNEPSFGNRENDNIANENADNSQLKTGNYKLDIGFRVLKCDTSNMEDVYYSPDHLDKQDLFKNNIKNDRTAEDLLFQVMLDLGIMLSSKIETKKINGKEVFCVEGNYLMACFDDSVDEKTITEIAKEKPYYFVMRDPANSKDGDSLITNFEQIFTTYSPDTVRKIL